MINQLKGWLGEGIINLASWIALDDSLYHRINNVTLPLPSGGTTQIDHVIVSQYGIFVIETKNYRGWIFGSAHQSQWTQVLHKRKYKFQNPLHQNYLHIKTLANLLKLDEAYFHSVIAFIGDCELKTREQLPTHVLNHGMMYYIKSKQVVLMPPQEAVRIAQLIEHDRLASTWQTQQAHKDYVKSKHHSPPKPKPAPAGSDGCDNRNAPTCPNCGGTMKQKVAKTGKHQGNSFWGCSQFPSCRGVISIGS